MPSVMARSDARRRAPTWWRHALIYQIYPRSFADANGDGVGDLAGVRSRLGYLRDLGVDAIWFTPWYVSPLADGGYDVADYRDIDPLFGTLAEAERLIAEAADARDPHDHRHRPQPRVGPAPVVRRGARGGSRLAVARPLLVPAGQGRRRQRAAERLALPLRRLGVDPHQEPRRVARRVVPAPVRARPSPTSTGTTPPYGPSTRTSSASGSTAAPAACASTRRRWRSNTPISRSSPTRSSPAATPSPTATSCTSCTASGGASPTTTTRHACSIGELWLEDRDRFALYLRPDELHGAFNFEYLAAPWDVDALRACIDNTLGIHASVGATPSWVLANHDVTRPLTRYGREDTSFSFTAKRIGTPTDPALGRAPGPRRGRAHRRPARLVLRVPG